MFGEMRRSSKDETDVSISIDYHQMQARPDNDAMPILFLFQRLFQKRHNFRRLS